MKSLITKRRNPNQKIPFHFFFRFAAEGWGEEAREKCKEIFWFLHRRVHKRVRGALYRFPMKSGRTERFRATTRSAACVSRQNPADFAHTMFELRPKNSAKKKSLNFTLKPFLCAEGVGFEPTEGCPSTVFKTAAFDLSATPPFLCNRKMCVKCSFYHTIREKKV
jgi:hypothetical protein